MNADPRNVIVTDSHCDACSTDTIGVYHQGFPELRLSAISAEAAAERLARRLEGFLDAVSDPPHREPVRRAIADVRAFLSRRGAGHPAQSS